MKGFYAATKAFWQGWKRLAHKIGNFEARILLTLFYAVLVFPFGIAVRLLADPLRIKKRPSHWLDHPDVANDMTTAQRQ